MKINTFTKFFLIVAFVGSQISAFAVKAGNDFNHLDDISILSVCKSASSLWKQTPVKQQHVSVLIQDSRHALTAFECEQSNSNSYKASSDFSINWYSTVSFAGYAQSPDSKLLPSINAYPNPSRGKTRLSLSHFGYDNYKIRVSNTIGKVMQTVELTGSEPVDVELDMSRYPAGVYFYSLIINDKTVETKRLILQK